MSLRDRNDRQLEHPAIGIASPEAMRQRLFAAAHGESVSGAGEPKHWMSADTLMRLFTQDNLDLLSVIEHEKPRSVSALAERVGREQGNISRTIAKFERAGILRLVADGREKRPEMVIRNLRIELDLANSRCIVVTDGQIAAE
ncbi:MAG TPA: MarR family transcriptional regulator [Skermanella sp.]|jgi:predicted transcriptional regulator|nr:MarR family transcriptional regulator [Skermanella sp.]